MSLEQIIARLVGQAEPGEAGQKPLLPAERRALSQRLRAIVDDAGGVPGKVPDRGAAADALRLAAYLDGSMGASEREAFEAELASSPLRRDELMASVAWIDAVEAQPMTPPAALTVRALALESPAQGAAATRGSGFAGWIEWLLPRPRLAIATSALASFAILAVGLDIALHMNLQFRAAIQPQIEATAPGIPDTTARQPPDRTFLPSLPGNSIILTAETINALLAYRDDPSAARSQELLTTLTRAGAPVSSNGVRRIVVNAQVYDRLTQRTGALPTRISARLSMNGELVISVVN
jgi:hypothetical protein